MADQASGLLGRRRLGRAGRLRHRPGGQVGGRSASTAPEGTPAQPDQTSRPAARALGLSPLQPFAIVRIWRIQLSVAESISDQYLGNQLITKPEVAEQATEVVVLFRVGLETNGLTRHQRLIAISRFPRERLQRRLPAGQLGRIDAEVADALSASDGDRVPVGGTGDQDVADRCRLSWRRGGGWTRPEVSR